MEAPPPPVPPKDAMEADHQKRKRALASEDEPSPKRRRSPLPQSEIDADGSDGATPSQQKNIRRMKGSRNLSNMNLRHAAERQKTTAAAAARKSRKSRFIEGSLTDKPSTKPPSMFTRFIRTDSGNIKQVTVEQEDLMDDYHNHAGPLAFVDKVIAQEKADIPGRVAQIEAEKENKSESGTFGKWASSLHPVSLWNKVFAQTREEIIREDFEEAERKAQEEAARKAREKADLEARYHEMKAAGMFKPKYLGRVTGPTSGSVSSRTTTIHAPHDSGIVIDDESSAKDSQDSQRSTSQMSSILKEPQEHHRSTSQMSAVLPTPQDDTTSASDAPETASKPAKTLKSRLHLKKPSLTNIQGSLKRAKSEWSLTQTLHHRESSSSISPIKTDFGDSPLKKSQSKHELKKQNKLSKRVSDLESKLSQARKELDEALVEASPMPKLGSRYERFTPQSTLKRPKIVPGNLPSLPSERILMEQQQESQMESKESDMNVKEDEVMGDAEAIDNIDLKEFTAEAQVKRSLNNTTEDSDDEGEDTMKARAPNRRRQYPTRAASLFTLNNNINIEHSSIEPTEPIESTSINEEQPQTSQLTQPTSSQIGEMDPNSITDSTTAGAVGQTTNPPDYASLDTKLKALDANVKKAAKAKKAGSKTKKRKSGANEMDKEYEPVKGTEEDTSDVEEDRTPKKKRKSILGFSSSSPNTKKAKKISPSEKAAKKTEVEVYSDVSVSPRGSFDSAQGRPLEAVPEEAEEDEMEQETVAVGSAAEEQMITRAAEAAKSNRSNEPVRISPGEMGVPALPGSVIRGKKEGRKAGIEQGEEFEWPPDVF